MFTRENLWLFLRGVAMGIADLVPGVSGGTIALITGIYEELITSLKSINLKVLKKLLRGNFSFFWKEINGIFLMKVGAGIVTGVFCLASFIHYLLENHTTLIWSFFLGLIIISFVVLVKNTKGKNAGYFILLSTGIVASWFFSGIAPYGLNSPTSFMLFISGAIAICAMLLPGISGSFILLILGVYDEVLNLVIHFDFTRLIIFLGGCVTGLLLFSKLVNWLLKNFFSSTMGFLSGVMIGSINQIWPWKHLVRMEDGSVSKSLVSPWFFAEKYSGIEVFMSFLCIFSGIMVVLVFEYISRTGKR